MNAAERIYRRRKARRKIRLLLMIPCGMLLLTLLSSELFLAPTVRAGARRKSRAAATYLINASVYRCMREKNIRYGDMISFEKNDDGQITALSADMAEMNDLKARITLDIYKNLAANGKSTLSIPLGSLTRLTFLAGKGPAVSFCFVPTGDITSNFRSDFSSGGINQTCHRIYLDVTVGITVLFPIQTLSDEVKTSVCLAETVIVGAVPDAFTNVQNIGNADDEISGDVVDFGAHNFLE